MVHQRAIDFGRYEMKGVLENFVMIIGISLTLIKLELSCDRLHKYNPGGLVRCFICVR